MKTSKFAGSGLRTVLWAAFVAGSLDIMAAFVVYAIILDQTTPVRMLLSIASGVFGKAAFEGGNMMAVYGLLFHFLIALAFALFYFLIYQYIAFPARHKLVSGIIYGIFIWLVMNMVVMPIAFSGMPASSWDAALLGTVIVISAVGLPIAYIIPTGQQFP
ncbi:DUF1440 domain-containing protein [Dyadobacter chenwenxiniae]|uniref:DUF1440 domain-containing protein n=1 Tax=Dyadobacter chenwenxiniae TaxID=2906456 RepID=A0A9X1TDV4_9BACT|nr:DUF1440 domain-containing protein [Dyadobacter chenwenxiniae]MCF0062336.1 DUF1440 domain-containing protein [Dyadobacter chenwenxiniae]UON83908.1 DUF1440 domain-containing protein [Dyadobacter chenwenxiniae]